MNIWIGARAKLGGVLFFLLLKQDPSRNVHLGDSWSPYKKALVNEKDLLLDCPSAMVNCKIPIGFLIGRNVSCTNFVLAVSISRPDPSLQPEYLT